MLRRIREYNLRSPRTRAIAIGYIDVTVVSRSNALGFVKINPG
jgi:hypothetical protein